jgi:DNA-binding CsgD family transcriptional regulator/tetratricopeptide (TPR) repeat protein
MFGRDRELAEAVTALEAAASGTPQVLLVGGDAGIGKTTLTSAIAEQARASGFSVLVGHCLDIDDGVALRPVREALRQAVAGRDEGSLSPVTHRLARYLRGEVDAVTVDELALVVAEEVAEGPVLLVLEDLHWADRSTIDVATSLARTARGPLCLALTYRADEINRTHPFRKALSDLARGSGIRRMDLKALDHDDISSLLEDRTGRADIGRARALFDRSEGNPLYAEELLATGMDHVPDPLSDLLLARVDGLSDDTRALLRLASAHGTRLDVPMLTEAAGADPVVVDASLREAIEANVIKSVGQHLEFRHGLLREAVYDDLMPGERARAHRTLAQALEGMTRPRTGMSELGLIAFHWYAAHDLPNAFRASVRAGQLAQDLETLDAVDHLERALELCDQVPEVGAADKADVLRMLARTHGMHAHRDLANRYIAQALDLVDEEHDPLTAARVYTTYVGRVDELPGRLGHEEAIGRAIALLDGRPTRDLVTALIMQGLLNAATEHFEAAEHSYGKAAEMAAHLGLRSEHASALYWGGRLRLWQGDLRGAVERFDAAAAIEHERHLDERAFRSHAAAGLAMIFGLDVEGGVAREHELRGQARAQGWSTYGSLAGFHEAQGLVSLGRFDEAELVLASVFEDGGLLRDDYYALLPQVMLALAQGSPARALELERGRYEGFRSLAGLPNPDWVLLHIEVLVANDLAEEALARGLGWLAAFAESDNALSRGVVAHAAYLAIELARRKGLPDVDRAVAEADAFFGHMQGAVDFAWQCSLLGHSTSVATALRAELHGVPSADLWRTAYDAAAHLGAGLVLPIRLRLIRALLAEGRRDEARTSLPEVVADAKAMGMNGVLEEALKLGRRHRIPVPGDDRPSKLDILTGREREVLDVLVTGATNKAIAERLFISEKTVSVHVTNLLAKLGVTNRTEAAAVFNDLAMVDPS